MSAAVAAFTELVAQALANVHDGAQQRFVGIALSLRLLDRRIDDDPAAVVALAVPVPPG